MLMHFKFNNNHKSWIRSHILFMTTAINTDPHSIRVLTLFRIKFVFSRTSGLDPSSIPLGSGFLGPVGMGDWGIGDADLGLTIM